jgi:hypothetical protein
MNSYQIFEYLVGLGVFAALILSIGAVLLVADKDLCKLATKPRKRAFRTHPRVDSEDAALEFLRKMVHRNSGLYRAAGTTAWLVLGYQYKKF